MIVEQRDYHVHTGKLPEVLRHYEQEGIPLQQEILGGLVGAVVFLCTPAADFITGQTMVIDGGQYFH